MSWENVSYPSVEPMYGSRGLEPHAEILDMFLKQQPETLRRFKKFQRCQFNMPIDFNRNRI